MSEEEEPSPAVMPQSLGVALSELSDLVSQSAVSYGIQSSSSSSSIEPTDLIATPQVHPLGKIVFPSHVCKINSIVNQTLGTLQKVQQLSSAEKTKLNKLLVTSSSMFSSSSLLEQNKTLLRSCSAALHNAIEKDVGLTSRESAGARLEDISKQLSLTCDFDEDEEAYLVAHSEFFVEITMVASGNATLVKVTHGDGDEEEDCRLRDLVNERRMVQVFEGIRSLKHMHGPHNNIPVPGVDEPNRFKSLLKWEADVLKISEFETKNFTPIEIVRRGNGLIQKRCGVTKLHITFWSDDLPRASDTFASDDMDVDGGVNVDDSKNGTDLALLNPRRVIFEVVDVCDEGGGAYSGVASVARNELTDSHSSLSTVSLQTTSERLGFIGLLTLESPILFQQSLAQTLLLTARYAMSLEKNARNHSTTEVSPFLTMFLKNSGITSSASPVMQVRIPVADESVFSRFVFRITPHSSLGNDSAAVSGVDVSHIPLAGPLHLWATLSILRRQLVFTSLLNSCCKLKKDDPSTPPVSTDICCVSELSILGTCQILLLLQHPTSARMASVLITVESSTQIKTEINVHTDDVPPTATSDLSRVLQQCLSIPEGLHRCWLEKTVGAPTSTAPANDHDHDQTPAADDQNRKRKRDAEPLSSD